MKKKLDLHSDFHFGFFSKSTYIMYLIGEFTDNYQKVIQWMIHTNSITIKLLEQESSKEKGSLYWAKEFCDRYSISEGCIDDFAFMHYFISNFNIDKQGHLDERNQLRDLNTMKKLIYDTIKKPDLVQGIAFNIKGDKSVVIKHKLIIELILASLYSELLKLGDKETLTNIQKTLNGNITDRSELLQSMLLNTIVERDYFGSLTKIKNASTHDLKVYSWALLNYFKQFTKYTPPKNTLATNEQCRMIYEILKDAGLISYHTDEEDYIRAYLKQASVMFS